MTLRDVLGLRPKGDTAAALRASLTDTETALASMRSIAAGLEAERGAVLLDASPAEAEAHGTKLMAARGEAAAHGRHPRRRPAGPDHGRRDAGTCRRAG